MYGNILCLQPEVFHELEVEIARPDYLLATITNRGRSDVPQSDCEAYDELMRAFVNDARIMVRNAEAKPHDQGSARLG